ncbi:type IV conjugative transfer system protein TraL [Vibrio maritimus]|jgi:hypothetical protein|uniref:type IV conjugative transfer system protein TraL n=1 Tax=Vibrio maritimus TaxID=990268 RepID=UPI0040682DC5
MSKIDVDKDAKPALPETHTYIPTGINQKWSLMSIESDTLGIILGAIAIGNYTRDVLPFMVAGIFIAAGYAYIKGKYPRGRLKHLLWWYGLINTKQTRSKPNPYNRRFYK